MAIIENQREKRQRTDPRFARRQNACSKKSSVSMTLVERMPLTLEEKKIFKKELMKLSSLSSPTKTAPTDEGWTSLVQISPKHGLRVATLRSRFADTIFRAKQSLLDHDKKMKQETTQTVEDKDRIEAQIRAAQEASRMRAEEELKMQRARAREAARIEIENVTNTTNFNDAYAIMRDFEALIQAQHQW